MFLIRQSKPEDASTLLKLARTVYFINLPPNEQIIAGKIEQSQRCFRAMAGKGDGRDATVRPRKGQQQGLSHAKKSDFYMFTILDAESGSVVGTSQLIARMGGPGDPNWAMKISEKKFHSESLRFGTTHTVGQLFGDESGPTEVGGLILDPGFRGHRLKPGRFLSFARFQLIGMFRDRFADRVLAEMMAPVTEDGDNAFWDCFGRKFIPVKYAEADRFCQHNRRFIEELLPKDEIYLTLLPLEVLNQVAQVSAETVPARRLLESLGFRYRGHIDPFDGGPHLDAPTDDIPLVRDTDHHALGEPVEPQRCTRHGLVARLDGEGEFRAVETAYEHGRDGAIHLPEQSYRLLGAEAGDRVAVTPVAGPAPAAPDAALGGSARAKAPRPGAPRGDAPHTGAKAAPADRKTKPAPSRKRVKA